MRGCPGETANRSSHELADTHVHIQTSGSIRRCIASHALPRTVDVRCSSGRRCGRVSGGFRTTVVPRGFLLLVRATILLSGVTPRGRIGVRRVAPEGPVGARFVFQRYHHSVFDHGEGSHWSGSPANPVLYSPMSRRLPRPTVGSRASVAGSEQCPTPDRPPSKRFLHRPPEVWDRERPLPRPRWTGGPAELGADRS